MVAAEAPAEPRTAVAPRRSLRPQPALDGLRAVAVIGVMLFHGGLDWVPGGYLGVDVFFVISGYLITALLLQEWVAHRSIDLAAFWVRRLRRLLPALLVLLAGIGLASPFLVDGPERAGVRGDGLAALANLANWHFIFTEQSYFAGAPSPLRHLWSLAVEAQWYVVFPLVFALILRRARSITTLLAPLVVAAVASAVWMAHLASGPVDPSRAYYGTDARAHSLLVGAILAGVAAWWPLHRARRLLSLVGVVGFVVVLGAYLLVDESDGWMYQGGFLAFAVCCAAVVAAVALPRRPTPLAAALSARPLVAIGKVSYGLYLWHWPVNVFLTPDRLGLDGRSWFHASLLLTVRTAVAVTFAVVSYRLVEVPVRRGGLDGLRLRLPGVLRPRLASAVGCVVLATWLLVAGTLRTPEGDGATTAAGLPASLAQVERGVPDLPEAPVPTIPAEVRRLAAAGSLPAVPADRPVKVLTVGDSVAWTLVWGQFFPGSLVVKTRALIGCGVVAGYPLPGGRIDRSTERCGDWPRLWQDGVAKAEPDVVMVQFGAWEVFDHLVRSRTIESPSEEMRALIHSGLDRGIEAVLAVKPDVRFVFIGAPCMHEANDELGGADSPRNDSERVAWVNDVFREFSAELGTRSTFIDLGQLMCPGGEPREDFDGVDIRPDGSHYRMGAAGPVWEWLAPRIIAFARRSPGRGPS